jgi:hypothetical protein
MKTAIWGLAMLASAGSLVIAGDSPQERRVATTRDSGRYGVAASCSLDRDWVACEVSVRDLVYETLLLPPRQMKATLDGRLGESIQVETNPAQGKAGRVGISVSTPDVKATPMLAKVVVQVTEGDHVVQDYSLSFPVLATPAGH